MAIEFVHLHAEVKDGCVILTQASDGGPPNVISFSVDQFDCICELLSRDIERYHRLKINDSDVVR